MMNVVLQAMDWAGEKRVYSKAAYRFSAVLESSSCLFSHLGQSICCNPQRAVTRSVVSTNTTHWASAACSLVLPLPTWYLLFSFFLHYFALFHIHWNCRSLLVCIYEQLFWCVDLVFSPEPNIGFMLIADCCLNNWEKGCQGILKDQPFPLSPLLQTDTASHCFYLLLH